MSWLDDSRVVIWKTDHAAYPSIAPFDPSDIVPELGPGPRAATVNSAHQAVRGALMLLGQDPDRYGSDSWNPLKGLIAPGDHVLIKPNLIRGTVEGEEAVVTHGSVIRAVLDYVVLALGGKGSVSIADGPQTDSDFEAIVLAAHLRELAPSSPGIDFRIIDLRRHEWRLVNGVISSRRDLPGDPRGYSTVDLGHKSAFATYRLNGDFYGADYDVSDTARFHSNGKHEYVLCRTASDADVIINLPKMKTHKKTGVTLSLKNIVGVNGYRNCLPHHTNGTPAQGGDEFQASDPYTSLQSRALKEFKRALVLQGGRGGPVFRLAKRVGKQVFGDTDAVVRNGNWSGNDTTWRMVLDLNRALLHYDSGGNLRTKPVRYLTLVDGIVGGEGNGPTKPTPVPSGVVVAGMNPLAVDTACCRLMGFDIDVLPMVREAWREHPLPLALLPIDQFVCESNEPRWRGSLARLGGLDRRFQPHFGWRAALQETAIPNEHPVHP